MPYGNFCTAQQHKHSLTGEYDERARKKRIISHALVDGALVAWNELVVSCHNTKIDLNSVVLNVFAEHTWAAQE